MPLTLTKEMVEQLLNNPEVRQELSTYKDELVKLLPHLEQLIGFCQGTETKLKGWIDDLQTQETIVNSVKTTAAVGWLGGVGLVLTGWGAAPGLLLIASSLGGGALTTIGDMIANKVKSDMALGEIEQGAQLREQVQTDLKNLAGSARRLAEIAHLDEEAANAFIFLSIKAGTTFTSRSLSLYNVTYAVDTERLWKLFEVWRSGALFPGAAAGARAGTAVMREIAMGTTLVSKALFVVGGIITIYDAIDGWVFGNATKNDLEERKKSLVTQREHLQGLKAGFDDVLAIAA